MRIGEVIKQRRVALKLTQEELAEKCNVTPQAVSRWENEISLPDITLVPRLSEVLKVSCDNLLKGSGPVFTHYALSGGIAIDLSEVMIQNDIDVIFGYRKMEDMPVHRRVLHADDAQFLQDRVQEILSSQGYEGLQAKDGDECMELLAMEKVDILLLDINMPGNGLEILAKVKEIYPELPVLMLSAMADGKTVRKTLELGAAGFVAKPFQAEALLEHLGSI